jgi:uncharacterized protein (TIGR02246 family)
MAHPWYLALADARAALQTAVVVFLGTRVAGRVVGYRAGVATNDERAIRELVDTWARATETNDIDTVLGLMADDVLFLTPGSEPFGKEEFENAARERDAKVESVIEVEELEVTDDRAWMRNHLRVTMTPPGGSATRRSGYALTILRRRPDGRWVIARDANLLPPPS